VREARPLGGDSRVGRGWLAFLPLVPWVRQQVAPERVARDGGFWAFDFHLHVADAVVRDLRAAGVARTVARSGLAGVSGPDQGGRYTLELAVEEGVWNRHITAYGLSVAGVALWMLGAPNSFGDVELALAAELRDGSGRSLGRTRVVASEPVVEWIYHSPFWSDLREVYAQMLALLRPFVIDAIRVHRERAGGH
jgi:hypothetical protein